ncbi:hypothetical protein OSTOST_20224, partial [Ostertagia ostertagi]
MVRDIARTKPSPMIDQQKELRKEIEHEQKVQENKEEKQEKESTDKKDVRAKSKLEGKKSKEKSKEDQKDGRAKTKIEGKTPKNDAKPKKPTGDEETCQARRRPWAIGFDLETTGTGYPKRPAMEQHKMRTVGRLFEEMGVVKNRERWLSLSTDSEKSQGCLPIFSVK